MDASVGLDGVVATFAQQRDGDQQEEIIQRHSAEAKITRAEEAKAAEATLSRSKAAANADKRPKQWTDLAKVSQCDCDHNSRVSRADSFGLLLV